MGKWDDARAERDFRMNPPDLAPGQGSGDDWGDLLSESPLDTDNSVFSGSENFVGSVLDQTNINNTSNNNNQQNTFNSQQSMTPEWDAMVAGAKVAAKVSKVSYDNISGFISALFKSFSNNTEGDWHNLGSRMFKISAISIIVGLVLLILKPLIPSINQPQTLMAGGSITAIISVILLFKFEKSDISSCQALEELPIVEDNGFDDDFSDISDDFSFEDDDEVDLDSSEGDFDWDEFSDDFNIEEDDDDEEVVLTGVGTEGFSVDDEINSIQITQPGVWTRQYLFEMYCRILPNITPSYSKIETISSSTDEFMMFSEYIRGAAMQVGIKEENIPELTEIRKTLFIIQLRSTRPTVAKEQEIADAVADMYSRDEMGNVVRDGVYATVDSMIGVFVINIFTGNTAMVSLKDIYDKIADYVKDVEVKMPFVWGISEKGDPYYCDLINCDSILISGEGRGGKSWKGQSIMAQLAMYNSPKEVEFYIFDNKDTSSDYRYPSTVLPHIRYFCGDIRKHNSGLKKLIDYTIATNGKILAENECLNIKDYNRKHPDAKLPYRYVVIDEIMALMNAYTKEEQEEFRSYMSTIVSKLPYLGLRLVLFPHRIVDFVISKNTYSLVSTRAIVRQLNEDEIKNAMGVSKRQFPYKLTNFGDMAIRSKEIANGEVVFCHAEVLTKTNEDNKELFKFIGSVWRKLCPECKCMTIGKLDSEGGRVGDNVEEKVRKVNKPPVDHTKGNSEYNYQGYSNMSDTIEDFQSNEDDSEDFWDEVLKG